jgi:hypothetical protein
MNARLGYVARLLWLSGPVACLLVTPARGPPGSIPSTPAGDRP